MNQALHNQCGNLEFLNKKEMSIRLPAENVIIPCEPNSLIRITHSCVIALA